MKGIKKKAKNRVKLSLPVCRRDADYHLIGSSRFSRNLRKMPALEPPPQVNCAK